MVGGALVATAVGEASASETDAGACIGQGSALYVDGVPIRSLKDIRGPGLPLPAPGIQFTLSANPYGIEPGMELRADWDGHRGEYVVASVDLQPDGTLRVVAEPCPCIKGPDTELQIA